MSWFPVKWVVCHGGDVGRGPMDGGGPLVRGGRPRRGCRGGPPGAGRCRPEAADRVRRGRVRPGGAGRGRRRGGTRGPRRRLLDQRRDHAGRTGRRHRRGHRDRRVRPVGVDRGRRGPHGAPAGGRCRGGVRHRGGTGSAEQGPHAAHRRVHPLAGEHPPRRLRRRRRRRPALRRRGGRPRRSDVPAARQPGARQRGGGRGDRVGRAARHRREPRLPDRRRCHGGDPQRPGPGVHAGP